MNLFKNNKLKLVVITVCVFILSVFLIVQNIEKKDKPEIYELVRKYRENANSKDFAEIVRNTNANEVLDDLELLMREFSQEELKGFFPLLVEKRQELSDKKILNIASDKSKSFEFRDSVFDIYLNRWTEENEKLEVLLSDKTLVLDFGLKILTKIEYEDLENEELKKKTALYEKLISKNNGIFQYKLFAKLSDLNKERALDLAKENIANKEKITKHLLSASINYLSGIELSKDESRKYIDFLLLTLKENKDEFLELVSINSIKKKMDGKLLEKIIKDKKIPEKTKSEFIKSFPLVLKTKLLSEKNSKKSRLFFLNALSIYTPKELYGFLEEFKDTLKDNDEKKLLNNIITNIKLKKKTRKIKN